MALRAAVVFAMIALAGCQTKTVEAGAAPSWRSITAAVQRPRAERPSSEAIERREERQFERGASDETITFIDVA